MDESHNSVPTESIDAAGAEPKLPPGNHPLEVAARRGIGPLSALGREVWHGHTKPCVTCGQLAPRDATVCTECGQDLSDEMVERMRAHAGPWYVLEHVRPFPGVSLERIIRQVRRGLITETAIVRGPATDYQWRFAVETPGLCRYFGRCWHCHEEVPPAETHCPYCLTNLSFEQRRPAPAVPPSPQSVASEVAAGLTRSVGAASAGAPASGAPVASPHARSESPPGSEFDGTPRTPSMDRAESRIYSPLIPPAVAAHKAADDLKQLTEAVKRGELPPPDVLWDEPPRIAGIRATWVATVLIIVVIVTLLFVTQSRSGPRPPSPPPTPGIVLIK